MTGVFGSGFGDQKGIIEGHAYSIQRVVEIEDKRLILLRNPWGKGEWRGAWADGSKEWSPEWMRKLGHKFGEDGEFWICYQDLLRHFQIFERVRLFGPEWNVSQIWTTLHVPWVEEYNETYFTFTTTQSGPVVIVLSQLNDRYFRGLEGQYTFQLSFRVHKAGYEGYLVRSEPDLRFLRSVNVELELEAGAYEVYVKIKAWRNDDKLPVQATIRKWAKTKCDKVSRIGKSYDLAHSRGCIVESKEEKKVREAYEEKRMQKKRAAVKEDLRKKNKDAYYQKKKQHERAQARAAKKREKLKTKKAEKAKASKERKAAKEAAQEEAAKELTEKKTKANEDARKDKATVPSGAEPAKKPKEAADVKVESESHGVKNESKAEAKDGATTESKAPASEKPHTESKETSKKQNTDDKSEAKPKGAEKVGEQEDSEASESDSNNESLASFTDYSDGELNIQIDGMQRDNPKLFESSAEEADSDEENGLFAKDPWNAVAVVGLRVYHKAAAAGSASGAATVTLGVVRPNPYVEDSDASEDKQAGGDGGGGDRKVKGGVLDVDDSAVDATLAGEVKDKQDVIMGVKKTPA
ncbi:calpain-like protein [Beauveria brongniartii RCEF 3172]|uniref:Calpain-like protein n=1 Tax=Beauveria brongniartii RCEF 3172 TaxID=1081107 RepID=A0A167AKV6_9HYPO|nr:calpain-like protein [Beauveria brongniartii RCEF 3172]